MKRLPNLTRWPEPPPDEGEKPQWVIVAVVVVAVALGFWFARQSEREGGFNFSWRMPEISFPQVSTPNIDLRDRVSEPSEAPEVSVSESEPPPSAVGEPVVQNVPFETCSDMLDNFPNAGGHAPIVVEDTDDRRVRRFKLANGILTVTCARADNTLTIEPPN